MRKIAYKFLAVIGVLVAVSLISLQILSANIKTIIKESTDLLGKQVGDLNLIQVINRDYEEIYRVTLCHAMTNAESSMRSYEKQIEETQKELETSMAAYKKPVSMMRKIMQAFISFEDKIKAFNNTVDSIVANSAGGKRDGHYLHQQYAGRIGGQSGKVYHPVEGLHPAGI